MAGAGYGPYPTSGHPAMVMPSNDSRHGGHRSYAFKILSPKDIVGILTMIGVHAATPEMIDKPTHEATWGLFQHLGEFAYDMDLQTVKARAPATSIFGTLEHPEVLDEAADVLAIFRLSKQLVRINGIDDFSLKDICEPSGKRLRTVLSSIINFCRYKESQTLHIQRLKEGLNDVDAERLVVIDKADRVSQELEEAKARNCEESRSVYAAESEVQELRGVVERLMSQHQAASRVLEDMEKETAAKQERLQGRLASTAAVRASIAEVQGMIADSPEGLEEELKELSSTILNQKARIEDKTDQKRATAQRVQVMRQIFGQLEDYAHDVDQVQRVWQRREAAHEHTRGQREDLASLRRRLEARRAEEAELSEGIRQVTAELEGGKAQQDGRLREVDSRRHQALERQQELQERRAEEERQAHALQVQRVELEAEVAAERRRCEAAAAELRRRIQADVVDREAYAQTVDMLIGRHDAEVVAGWGCGLTMSPSPRLGGSKHHPGSRSQSPRGGRFVGGHILSPRRDSLVSPNAALFRGA